MSLFVGRSSVFYVSKIPDFDTLVVTASDDMIGFVVRPKRSGDETFMAPDVSDVVVVGGCGRSATLESLRVEFLLGINGPDLN